MKKGTLQEWERLGVLIKTIKYLTIEALTLSDKIMVDKEYRILSLMEEELYAFCDHAEGVMWKQLPKESRSVSIFYGDLKWDYDNPYLLEVQTFEEEDQKLPMEQQCPDFTKHLYEKAEGFDKGIKSSLIYLLGGNYERETITSRLQNV